MIGCGLRPNTCVHAVEETVKPPYLLGEKVDFDIINGRDSFVKAYRVHDFKGYAQRYDRMAAAMPSAGIRKTALFRAETFIIDCRLMWDSVAAILRKDPWFLVDRLTG